MCEVADVLARAQLRAASFSQGMQKGAARALDM
jgi:hypothetical protein